MDRYTFLAMGRRRIWIIAAQLVMIALLAGCAVIGPGVTDILLLGIAGCRGPADLHAVVRPASRRDPVHALHGDQQFRDQPRGVGAPLQRATGRVTDDVRGGFALHLVGLILMVLVKFPRRMAAVHEVAARLAEREGPQPAIN